MDENRLVDFLDCMNELKLYAFANIISDMQYNILYERAAYGRSYDALIKFYELSCPNVLITCLTRTVQGRRWEKGMGGGGQTYLSDVDYAKFQTIAMNAADDCSCITTATAITIAYKLKKIRRKKAEFILQNLHLPSLCSHLEDVEPPCKTWVKNACIALDLKVVRPQELDIMRRTCCDIVAVENFFSNFLVLLNRDPHLLLNMDETMLSGKRKLKVICRDKGIPLKTTKVQPPHISGAVTVSASGHLFDTFYILPNKKTLRNLESIEDAFLTSSVSGYMNKRLFIIYALFMCSQIQMYRMTLSPALREEPILLILDGHGSRINFTAALIFYIFNVDVLVLPGHTSHLLQPFDVSLGGPLKTEFVKLFDSTQIDLDFNSLTIQEMTKTTSQVLREILISCFDDALRRVCTKSNIKSGFEASGISPLCPSLPLESKYCMPESLGPKTTGKVSNMYLNSIEGLAFLYKEETGQEMTENNLNLDLEKIIESIWNEKNIEVGVVLSDRPTILVNYTTL